MQGANPKSSNSETAGETDDQVKYLYSYFEIWKGKARKYVMKSFIAF